jgi:hypothetical protein
MASPILSFRSQIMDFFRFTLKRFVSKTTV